LLVLDVDGVLTDGSIRYLGDEELQSFSVQDGLGLRWLVEEGISIAWITGRGCSATARRARELGVEELHVGAGPKDRVLRGIQTRLDVPPDATVAMGDDLPDLALARRSAFFACPPNARPQVRARADWVTSAFGGHGAVRELTEVILCAKGLWEARVARYGHRTE